MTATRATDRSLPLFATATLNPTPTLHPSATIVPPSITPTSVLLMVEITTQVNVRAGAEISTKSLGLLNIPDKVQVIGKSEDGLWLKIYYPINSSSTGWIYASFTKISKSNLDSLKITLPEPVQQPTGTQIPSVDGNLTPTQAIRKSHVKNMINVRSGPGQTFPSIGILSPPSSVILIGRNLNNLWIQIQYDASPSSVGWVAAAFLENPDLSGLPYFDDQGKPIGSTETQPGQTPSISSTSAHLPVADDGDSAQNPAVRVVFSPEGDRELSYSSDLSTPSGDKTDWVAFTPYQPEQQTINIYLKLECSGNGGITALVEADGQPLVGVKPLLCGNYGFAVPVTGGKEYLVVLNADPSGGPIRFVHYTLFVKSEN